VETSASFEARSAPLSYPREMSSRVSECLVGRRVAGVALSPESSPAGIATEAFIRSAAKGLEAVLTHARESRTFGFWRAYSLTGAHSLSPSTTPAHDALLTPAGLSVPRRTHRMPRNRFPVWTWRTLEPSCTTNIPVAVALVAIVACVPTW
jgi:hypothetical protein